MSGEDQANTIVAPAVLDGERTGKFLGRTVFLR